MASPAKSPDEEDSKSWMEWRQQLQAYVAWVNSQLKKKPGVRLIEDLRNDMKDGVAMIELIEIVGGERLSGIHLCPSTNNEMRENVERIIQYMTSNRIRMHHTNPKDIVDGNLKSIMRLILALAAHFKPQSVKHSTQANNKSSRSSVTGIAHGASAALAEARRNAAKAGNSFRRSRALYNYSDRRRTYHEGSSSEHFSDSDQSFLCDRTKALSRDDGDGASADKSPQSTLRFSPSLPDTSSPKDNRLPSSKSTEQVYAKDSGTELEDSGSNTVDRAQYEDLLQEYLELSDTMSHSKRELLKLQDLLLSGEPPDGAEDSPKRVIPGSSPAEQVVVLESQLIQAQEVASDIREELSRTKNDCMQLQGTKAGLQQRLSEQEEKLSQLKADLLRSDFEKQSLESEKNELKMKIYERDKTIADLRRDATRREQRIDQLQNEVQYQIQEKESITRALKQQISDLHERLRVVGERGASLSARVASQDKRMAKLEGQILNTGEPYQREATPSGIPGEELHNVRDSIHSLRLNFKTSDPQQRKLDSVENFVCSLLDKLQHHNNNISTVSNGQNVIEHGPSRRLNFDSTGDIRRSPITSIPGSHPSFSVNQLDHSTTRSKPSISHSTTKVLYFTDSNINANPTMVTIHKRLGDITLKDFKEHISVKGNYRYLFKALDPEFGTVKEEVMSDDDKVPGWEGQIVAWVEEDTG